MIVLTVCVGIVFLILIVQGMDTYYQGKEYNKLPKYKIEKVTDLLDNKLISFNVLERSYDNRYNNVGTFQTKEEAVSYLERYKENHGQRYKVEEIITKN